MTERLIVACIQVNTGDNLGANVENAIELVRTAEERGAQLVLMPEHISMIERARGDVLAEAVPAGSRMALTAFRALAAELRLWLHCGTLTVRESDGTVTNRTYVLRPNGTIAATYDKIHMFDADLDDEGGTYRESSTFMPGNQAVVVDTPWGGLGPIGVL